MLSPWFYALFTLLWVLSNIQYWYLTEPKVMWTAHGPSFTILQYAQKNTNSVRFIRNDQAQNLKEQDERNPPSCHQTQVKGKDKLGWRWSWIHIGIYWEKPGTPKGNLSSEYQSPHPNSLEYSIINLLCHWHGHIYNTSNHVYLHACIVVRIVWVLASPVSQVHIIICRVLIF